MQRGKTKKRTAKKKTAVKKVIKKTVRKKSTQKKSTSKKPTRRFLNTKKRTIKKKIAVKKVTRKSTRKKTTPRKKKVIIKTSLIFHSITPQKTDSFIKKTKTHLSPHVLDLKQLTIQQQNNNQVNNTFAQTVGDDFYSLLSRKKQTLSKSFTSKVTTSSEKINSFKSKLKFPAKKEVATHKTIKIKKSYHLPKFNLPKINLPEINFEIPKIRLPEIKIGRLNLTSYWQKALLSFIIFSFVFVLPFATYDHYLKLEGKKNLVLQKTADAILHLTTSQKAASAQDLYYTKFELEQASINFSLAKSELEDIGILTKALIKLVPQTKKQYTTAQNLISIGEKLSTSAAIITQALNDLNIDDTSIESLNLTDKLAVLKTNLNLILPDIKKANEELKNIHLEVIPQEYHSKIKTIQTALPLLETNIENFINSSDLLLNLLGEESKKRYLLLFQNNHEIRPTGGFIGSFALVDIDQGNLKKINILGGGPYDLKAGLEVSIESPRPLHLINPRWEFQDANWFANLPTSAEKLIWFYEKSGGPTVDGIIFINASFLEKILKITGPIEMPEYNKTITATNFYLEIQKNVELEYNKSENKPKQIIADLTPRIINALLSSGKKDLVNMLNNLIVGLNEKEIQMYFTNYSLEKLVLKNSWGGQIKNTDRDYLNIISTNIAGEKTDAVIKQSAELTVDIQPNGSIINTLNITKQHTGIDGQIFYGVPNLDYLRIYVPKGSKLIEASGFERLPSELFEILHPEIYQKDPDIAFIEMSREIIPENNTEIYNINDKTVFANWFKVNPGETNTVTIRYELPFQLSLDHPNDQNYLNLLSDKLSFDKNDENIEKYSLIWQKQSGRNNFAIDLNIIFPENKDFQLIHPNNFSGENGNFKLKDILNTDKIFALVFK